MFTHDMEENRKSKVDIVDLDGDTVHDMVRYIYSGKVCTGFDEHLVFFIFLFCDKINISKVSELEGKATGLLSAAEKYDLKVIEKKKH